MGADSASLDGAQKSRILTIVKKAHWLGCLNLLAEILFKTSLPRLKLHPYSRFHLSFDDGGSTTHEEISLFYIIY